MHLFEKENTSYIFEFVFIKLFENNNIAAEIVSV
jgi:hypothetical protein